MRRAAVIVGVDRYDRDPLIRQLQFTDSDCTYLHGLLNLQAGYDPVRLLRDPAKHEILDAVKQTVSELNAGDLLVFFFAGHGIEYAGKHLLLCRPAQLQWLKHFEEAIPVDHLRDLTAKPGLSRVLILDSCRSDLLQTRGAGSAGLKGEANLRDVVTQVIAPVEQEGSLTILCSCAEGKQALELPQRRQGLFTAALLEVMRENLRKGTELSVSDAFQQALAEQMTAIAKAAGHVWDQRPWIQRSGASPVLLPGRAAVVPGLAPKDISPAFRAAASKPLKRQIVPAVAIAVTVVLLGGAILAYLIQNNKNQFAAAENALAARNPEEAIARLNRVWNRWPGVSEAPAVRERALKLRIEQLLREASTDRQNYTAALGTLDKILELDHTHAGAIQLRGEIQKEQKIANLLTQAQANRCNHNLALSTLDQLLTLDPTHAAALQLRGEIQREDIKIAELLAQARTDRQNYTAALNLLNELLKLDPNHVEALQLHGEILKENKLAQLLEDAGNYADAKQWDDAKDALAEALRLNPDDPKATQLLANVRARQNQAFKTQLAQLGYVPGILLWPTGERATSFILLEAFSPSQVEIGKPFERQLRVTNIRNSSLSNVMVTEKYSDNYTINGTNPRSQQYDAKRLQWRLGDMMPGESQVIRVHGVATALGELRDVVTVVCDFDTCMSVSVTNIVRETKRVPSLRRAIYWPTGEQATSLIFLEMVSPNPIKVSDPFEYELGVTNISKNRLKNVMVIEIFSDNYKLSGTNPLIRQNSDKQLLWEIGDMIPGKKQVVRISGIATAIGEMRTCSSMVCEFDSGLVVPVKVSAQ